MRGKKGGPGWKIMPSKRDRNNLLLYRRHAADPLAAKATWGQHRIDASIQAKRDLNAYAQTWYQEYLKSCERPADTRDALSPPAPTLLAPPPAPSPSERPLGSFYEAWRRLRSDKFDRGRLTAATLKQDEYHWKLHIEPTLGGKRMEHLAAGPDALREWVRELSKKKLPKKGRTLASNTIRHAWSTLKQMLDDIDAEGWCPLQRNPARHPRVLEELPLPRTMAGRKKIVLGVEQLEALLSAPTVPIMQRLWVLAAVTAGLRTGELFGLRWQDVVLDEEAPLFTVTQAVALLGREGHASIQGLKTEDSERQLPMHPTLREALVWWQKSGWPALIGRSPKPADLIFPNRNGRPHRPAVAKMLRFYLGELMLPTTVADHPITFQALRRTYSTMVSRHPEAAQIKYVLMGHSPPNVDDAHYNDVDMERVRRVVNSLPVNVPLAQLTVGELTRRRGPVPKKP